jgi:hypothetical protein
MIKFLKPKTQAKPTSNYEYKIYLRYDEREQKQLQQILNEKIDWLTLLNVSVLPFDNEIDLIKCLKIKDLYILNNVLIRFIERIDNIKVLVFDVAALHMDVVKEKKYNISNADNYIDMTNNNQEIENVLLNLTKNINKGDIDV